jgi:folate-binding protein YgfZ
MSEAPDSPILQAMVERGGITADYHGVLLVPHAGDPAREYRAATTASAVFDRSHRTRLVVKGRAPAQMLTGILTGTMPDEPSPVADGVVGGTATYHAVLTPKGKMITDLWCTRLGDEEEHGFLLDIPVAGREGLLAHFGKFLPPRLAAVENVSKRVAAISVAGPDASKLLSKLALGLRFNPSELAELKEGEWRVAGDRAADSLIVQRTAEIWPEAFNLFGPSSAVLALWKMLVADGAAPAGLAVWSTLRVEAGRPVFGTDMDEDTIPVEAGIHDRAIDYQKGCYTGQEVIVRIRDRGHVNRTLKRLRLGDIPAPAKGTELFEVGSDEEARAVGKITSAVESPKFGEVVALGYVKRGVEGPVAPR